MQITRLLISQTSAQFGANFNYFKFLNVVYLAFLVLFALTLLVLMIMPKGYYVSIKEIYDNFSKKHENVGEILRFLIVGGIATLVDMFAMGVVMYLMQKDIYPSFINVFINTPTPSTLATIVGTTCGFIIGLIVNYFLSIAFVFNNKGKSKSAKGFIIFTLLSIIGLIINIIGTYIGFDLMKLNQWLIKIIMIIIVLVYNYISKKLILFKAPKSK